MARRYSGLLGEGGQKQARVGNGKKKDARRVPSALILHPGHCLRTQEGGGSFWGPAQPANPPNHIRKMFLRGKMTFLKRARNGRAI